METPSRYKSAKLEDTIIKAEDIEKIYKERRGLYLHGPVGTGKTYIAYAIKHHLEEKGTIVRFHNATDLLADIRHDFDCEPFSRKHVVDKILDSRKLLIIDDLGAEKPTEWVAEILYRIINYRYENELPVIITSNLSLDQLAQRLGDRTASRLTELCDINELTGRDRRLQSK